MRLLRIFLAPFGLIFLVITELRNFIYNTKILRSSKFDLPVISVGNLSVGGTGKTPHIEFLIRLLNKQYKTATLSRGYKRKTKEYLLLTNESSVETGGDEPLQFKKKFPETIVAVDSNRVNGVMHLLGDHPETEVVLLDDAYQHRAIQPGLNILLTDYSDPFVLDFILPVGNLREMRKNANRADIVIVTKCSANIPSESEIFLRRSIQKHTDAEIYFSHIIYGDLRNMDQSILNPEELVDKSVLLITGIANPKPLVKYIEPKAKSLNHLAFPDHHRFNAADIQKMVDAFNNLPGEKIIITTEKDAMRLLYTADEKARIPQELPVYIQEIKIEFKDQEKFEKRINDYVREHQKKH
jgi:tetraacyldisaccharide 4'-kinase